MLGQVITHSLLSEGPGFPFFAPFVYRYIASGSAELAVQFVTEEDHHPEVAEMLSKVSTVKRYIISHCKFFL